MVMRYLVVVLWAMFLSVPVMACLAISTPTFTGFYANGLDFQWGGTCPSSSTYYVEGSTHSGFGSVYANTVSSSTNAGFSGLRQNALYYVRVSTNAGMQNSVVLGSTTTLLDTAIPSASIINPSSGETISGEYVFGTYFEDYESLNYSYLTLTVDGQGVVAASSSTFLNPANVSYYTVSSSHPWDSSTVPDGAHTIAAQAFDEALNESTEVSFTFYTANQPGNVGFSSINADSFSCSWALAVPSTQEPTYMLGTDQDFIQIVSSATAGVGVSSAVFSDLTPNTTYFFRVKASSAPDVSYTSPVSAVTLAILPSAAHTVFSQIQTTGFSAHWAAAGNIPGTLYEAEASLTNDFSDVVSAQSTSGLTLPFQDLSLGTTYYVRVRAVNHAGVPTAYAFLGGVQTFLYGTLQEQNIVVNSGAVVVGIPANTFLEDYVMQVSTNPQAQPAGPVNASSLIVEANQKIIRNSDDKKRTPVPGTLIQLAVTNQSGQALYPQRPISLTFQFNESNGYVSHMSESVRVNTLAVYGLNENTGLWVKLPSQMDSEAGTVTAQAGAYSVFAVMGQLDTSLIDAFAYPVPFEPSQGHTSIYFTNLAQSAVIQIYSMTGHQVRTLYESDGDAQYAWDARDEEGRPVASGVYYYVIKSATDKKTGRLMIIR